MSKAANARRKLARLAERERERQRQLRTLERAELRERQRQVPRCIYCGHPASRRIAWRRVCSGHSDLPGCEPL